MTSTPDHTPTHVFWEPCDNCIAGGPPISQPYCDGCTVTLDALDDLSVLIQIPLVRRIAVELTAIAAIIDYSDPLIDELRNALEAHVMTATPDHIRTAIDLADRMKELFHRFGNAGSIIKVIDDDTGEVSSIVRVESEWCSDSNSWTHWIRTEVS